MSEDEKRRCLDAFSDGQIDVNELSQSYPDCGCENASSPQGSFGPVGDEEMLWYFITSVDPVDYKKPARVASWNLKPRLLRRVFRDGLSAYRLKFADAEELEQAAKMLFDHSTNSERTDADKHGGVVGILSFRSDVIRQRTEDLIGCCVLETPLDPLGQGKFRRPSHCDVVAREPLLDSVAVNNCQSALFNHLIANATETRSEDVTACNLFQYLPVSYREKLEQEQGD